MIVYLIRKRLGLKKDQTFRFKNQRGDYKYVFKNNRLVKLNANGDFVRMSRISLNFLLSDKAKGLIIYEK